MISLALIATEVELKHTDAFTIAKVASSRKADGGHTTTLRVTRGTRQQRHIRGNGDSSW